MPINYTKNLSTYINGQNAINTNGGVVGPTLSTTGSSVTGGNKAVDDLYAFFTSLVSVGSATGVFTTRDQFNRLSNDEWPNPDSLSNAAATAGGTSNINSVSMGSYDYTFYASSQTVSSFNNGNWFTTTADSRSAMVYVNGNLTINSGQTFTPSNRKLFTAIFVNGDLVVNGTISMDKRGSNHGGVPVSAGNLKLISPGTYSSISNPQIPSGGGAGAPGGSVGQRGGQTGSAGSAGGTGGGGGGARYPGNGVTGAGQPGTSFSGGPGGGSSQDGGSGGTGAANGGVGGPGGGRNGGGAGNPGGPGTNNGVAGTGGVLLIYVTGDISGSGTITAIGPNNAPSRGGTFMGGASSGGGSITVFAGSDNFTGNGTLTAAGGPGGTQGGDGAGGAGTSRILSIPAS